MDTWAYSTDRKKKRFSIKLSNSSQRVYFDPLSAQNFILKVLTLPSF
jgi:hypothetical protein